VQHREQSGRCPRIFGLGYPAKDRPREGKTAAIARETQNPGGISPTGAQFEPLNFGHTAI
jgi:hypothetical protein